MDHDKDIVTLMEQIKKEKVEEEIKQFIFASLFRCGCLITGMAYGNDIEGMLEFDAFVKRLCEDKLKENNEQQNKRQSNDPIH